VTISIKTYENPVRLRALDIEALALSRQDDPPRDRGPDSSQDDGFGGRAQSKSRGRAILRWLAVSMLLAGACWATIYAGAWVDPFLPPDP
jgi:hypothetical protein